MSRRGSPGAGGGAEAAARTGAAAGGLVSGSDSVPAPVGDETDGVPSASVLPLVGLRTPPAPAAAGACDATALETATPPAAGPGAAPKAEVVIRRGGCARSAAITIASAAPVGNPARRSGASSTMKKSVLRWRKEKTVVRRSVAERWRDASAVSKSSCGQSAPDPAAISTAWPDDR